MAKIIVQLNSAQIRQYLTSPSVTKEVMRRAQALKQKAGEGYEVEDASTKARARARVYTKDDRARVRESREGNLRRALGSE